MNKLAYISLGPSCVPAEILKASGLRTCTFGFDWFRSGSFFIEEFLRLPLEYFLHAYVYNPCLPLRQLVKPENKNFCTVEPSAVKQCFGFPYLYNPHRFLGSPSTKEYFSRSFARLHAVLNCPLTSKIFLLADYINKPDASFLDDHALIAEQLVQLLGMHSISGDLYLIRIEISGRESFSIRCEEILASAEKSNLRAFLCNVSINFSLDDESVRSHTYRKIGSQLFKQNLSSGLWNPCQQEACN